MLRGEERVREMRGESKRAVRNNILVHRSLIVGESLIGMRELKTGRMNVR